ncbi:MAG TPA: VOC family protein [Rudaea sp.]|nr:VOC family protein [Rudaea sp.]
MDKEILFRAGAVVYAKNIDRIARFYSELAELGIVEREPGFVVLESAAFQLVVVAVRPAIAARIAISAPPARREDAAVKLCFAVADLAAARACAADLGGELNAPEREWEFRGSRVCDGYDPEGNIFQVRAPLT